MAQSLAPREQLLLVAGRHALGRVDERLQLGEPRSATASASRVSSSYAPPRRDQLAPGELRLAPALDLLGAAERVEHVELERRPREPALLELARHRDQALGGGRDVLARDRASPRVRARSPVAEDAPRDHEPGLALGPQLGERGELLVVEEAVRHVELGLDVRLGPVGADRRRVGPRAEQQPDRLREDRLPRTGLARHRVQARARTTSSASRMRTRFSIRSLRSMSTATVADRSPLYARRRCDPAVRDLAIVLAISWLARVAFIAAIGDAHSLDVDY